MTKQRKWVALRSGRKYYLVSLNLKVKSLDLVRFGEERRVFIVAYGFLALLVVGGFLDILFDYI